MSVRPTDEIESLRGEGGAAVLDYLEGLESERAKWIATVRRYACQGCAEGILGRSVLAEGVLSDG